MGRGGWGWVAGGDGWVGWWVSVRLKVLGPDGVQGAGARDTATDLCRCRLVGVGGSEEIGELLGVRDFGIRAINLCGDVEVNGSAERI